MPAGGQIVTQGWRADFSDWDDYDGVIPGNGDFIHLVFNSFRQPVVTADRPNLDSLLRQSESEV
jgi:hypothetical protein